jgi:hypothetical protein
MTQADPAPSPTLAPRPPMPSIAASVLIESRQLVQALTAWLTKG